MRPARIMLPRRRLGRCRQRDALAQLALDVLEHRPEEVPLVLVLMIEGAPRHAGPGDQVLGRRPREAALAEQVAGSRQEPLLGGARLLLLAASAASRRPRKPVPQRVYP